MTNADYPRMMFHPHKDPVTVHSREQEDALGGEWSRTIPPPGAPTPEPLPEVSRTIYPPPSEPEPEEETEPNGDSEPPEPEPEPAKRHSKPAPAKRAATTAKRKR